MSNIPEIASHIEEEEEGEHSYNQLAKLEKISEVSAKVNTSQQMEHMS